MKTENEINKAIMKVTSLIQDAYPEIYKYLSERPAKIIDSYDPEVDVKTLTAYYESLQAIFDKYAMSHQTLSKQIL